MRVPTIILAFHGNDFAYGKNLIVQSINMFLHSYLLSVNDYIYMALVDLKNKYNGLYVRNNLIVSKGIKS